LKGWKGLKSFWFHVSGLTSVEGFEEFEEFEMFEEFGLWTFGFWVLEFGIWNL
jgi:hypothetical protein